MKKTMAVSMLFVLIGFSAMAQWGDEQLSDKPSIRDRMFTGGGVGMSFSSYSDFFSISPIVGYKISNKAAAGIMFQYRYTKYKQPPPSVTANDYGISPFLRYNFYGPLFLHVEYEYLNYQYFYNGEPLRKSFNSFMAGGGFFQPVGRRAGFYAMALYNFSYQNPNGTSYYPYNSPLIFRVGITAGF